MIPEAYTYNVINFILKLVVEESIVNAPPVSLHSIKTQTTQKVWLYLGKQLIRDL
jgi:hypothetical protein